MQKIYNVNLRSGSEESKYLLFDPNQEKITALLPSLPPQRREYSDETSAAPLRTCEPLLTRKDRSGPHADGLLALCGGTRGNKRGLQLAVLCWRKNVVLPIGAPIIESHSLLSTIRAPPKKDREKTLVDPDVHSAFTRRANSVLVRSDVNDE